MENIILIIRELQGILGTISGAITTLIVTNILRNKGKLKTYLIDWEDKYETFKDVKCYSSDTKISDFYHYTFTYTLQVYNKSEVPKIMRNFKVNFYDEKTKIFSYIPDDETTRRYSNHRYHTDKMEVINISPKEIQVLKQSGYVKYEELEHIEGASKVDLTYYDERNKRRAVTLYKGIISKKNYTPKSV